MAETVAPVDLSHFRFLSWKIFDENYNRFESLDEIQAKTPSVFQPYTRKHKIVYISHRTIRVDDPNPKKTDWEYMKKKRAELSTQFDGLWYDTACRTSAELEEEYSGRYTENTQLVGEFIRRCYVLVLDPYHVVKERFWMLWECLEAAKNRKLVINESAIDLLKDVGTNPSFDKVQTMLQNAQVSTANDEELKRGFLNSLEKLYYKGSKYVLIPVDEILKRTDWESVKPVPLDLDHVDQSRVLMISHRWETEEHPDKNKKHPERDNRKLRIIQKFLRCQTEIDAPVRIIQEYLRSQNEIDVPVDFSRKSRYQPYDYVFFDYVCISQKHKSPIEQLVKINELYANSPCLCICDDEDYFQRSWCLFEICINKFNHGEPMIYGLCKEAQASHNILNWLDHARLVQRMGYVHALDDCNYRIQHHHHPNKSQKTSTKKDELAKDPKKQTNSSLKAAALPPAKPYADSRPTRPAPRRARGLRVIWKTLGVPDRWLAKDPITTELKLPEDQLHLKMQLRSLVKTSHLTNQGDMRIILNLLDKLVPAAPE